MKYILFAFIGSLLGVLSMAFMRAPYLVTVNLVSTKTNSTPLENVMGVFGTSMSSIPSFGYLVSISMIVSLFCLVLVVANIFQNKKTSAVVLALSSMSVLTIILGARFISHYVNETNPTSVEYHCGWGLIVVFILLGAWFILSMVQLVLDAMEARKELNKSEK